MFTNFSLEMSSEAQNVENASSGSPGTQLFLISLVMLGGSYVAGSAPLIMSLSGEKLQRVSGD